MKINVILYSVLITAIFGTAGCKSEDGELKMEAKTIAGVMCKSIGVMNELKAASPADSALVNKLQAEYQIIQTEMATLYQEFRTKYAEQTTSGEFNETFRKYLNESMLDCKNLSKEERESFEKGLK